MGETASVPLVVGVATVGPRIAARLVDQHGRGARTDGGGGDNSDDGVEVGRSGKSERNERGVVRETGSVGKEDHTCDEGTMWITSRNG